MKKLPGQQKGGSPIVTIITLAVLGYGVYIGIQYVPQFIESKSVDSILSNIESSQRTDPVRSEQAAKTKVIRMLQVNEMDDMTDSFSVRKYNDTITIKFSYDRELNLGYKIKPIHYESEVSLN